MAEFKAHEKPLLEKIFDRGGYVLNFSDTTFAAFFREHELNIDAEKYKKYGTSKMNRLRAFLEIEENLVVGTVLKALLEYACEVGTIDENYQKKALAIIQRLIGHEISSDNTQATEQAFLSQKFNFDLNKLNVDTQLHSVIEQRIKEIHCTLSAKAPLSVIFLCGSTLEGLLLDAASKEPQKFNQAKAAPKDNKHVVKEFSDWTLDHLINVAHEIGSLSLDIKKFSHGLKDFRNYIHPREQATQSFNPDMHTAEICSRVLEAAIADLCEERNPLP